MKLIHRASKKPVIIGSMVEIGRSGKFVQVRQVRTNGFVMVQLPNGNTNDYPPEVLNIDVIDDAQPRLEQLNALANFIDANGKHWKQNLAEGWERGFRDGTPGAALLQQLRNQFGPRWLSKYRIGQKKVGVMVHWRVDNEDNTNDISMWSVDNLEGDEMLPRVKNKADIRHQALAAGITLLED